MKVLSALFLYLLVFTGFLNAHNIRSIPNPKHKDKHTYVSNPDGILFAGAVRELNSMLDDLEQETGAEVAVVAVKSIGNSDIKVFATDLFEAWGIGKAGTDNGFLILFVENQRKITFETGYGLEDVLPDVVCKRIQMNKMIPYFKDGDYNNGILTGTREVVSVIRGRESEPVSDEEDAYMDENIPVPVYSGNYGISDSDTGSDRSFMYDKPAGDFWSKDEDALLPNILVFAAVFVLVFILIVKMVIKTEKDPELSNVAKCIVIRREKKGIFVSVGAALFFIGVFAVAFFVPVKEVLSLLLTPVVFILANTYANRRMRVIENTPVFCNLCQYQMRLLTNKEEKKYLQSSQILEEDLNSVLYDVYYCDNCRNNVVYKLNIPGKYTACPECKNKTYSAEKSVTLRRATYTSTGLRRVTYKCKYCNYKNQVDVIIPRKEDSDSSSGSSSSSSSSGSSSSGGSFGGGSSGGGGSTSSW